jgi:hypothetical protein
MSTANISKSAIAAAISLLVVAGCDSGVRSERSSATQASANQPRPLEWYEARPDTLRARLDAARGRIWALHGEGIDLYDARSDQKLRSIALPEWVWAHAFHSCPPDVAVGPGGEVVVSSNVVPVLWRIDPATFQVSRHELAVVDAKEREIGFSGMTYSTRQGAFLGVNGMDGSLWRIDPALARAQQIPLSAPLPRACGVSAKADAAGKPTLGAFCVQTEDAEWTVYLAPDYRSGYTHRTQCSIERPASRTSVALQ